MKSMGSKAVQGTRSQEHAQNDKLCLVVSNNQPTPSVRLSQPQLMFLIRTGKAASLLCLSAFGSPCPWIMRRWQLFSSELTSCCSYLLFLCLRRQLLVWSNTYPTPWPSQNCFPVTHGALLVFGCPISPLSDDPGFSSSSSSKLASSEGITRLIIPILKYFNWLGCKDFSKIWFFSWFKKSIRLFKMGDH